jgi:hypothetical protein
LTYDFTEVAFVTINFTNILFPLLFQVIKVLVRNTKGTASGINDCWETLFKDTLKLSGSIQETLAFKSPVFTGSSKIGKIAESFAGMETCRSSSDLRNVPITKESIGLTWGNTKTNNSLVNHTSVFQGLDEA